MVKYAIESTIESLYEGNAMDEKEQELMKTETNGDIQKNESDGYHHLSKAKSNKSGFFHNVSIKTPGVNQITNVQVNVAPEPEENPVSGCFRAILSCIKK